MKHIYSTEGFARGLYKGYFAYMFAIVFWAAALPQSTEAMMNVYPYLQSIRNRKTREQLIEQ